MDDVRAALWASKVVAYAQGLDQIREASTTYDWDVDVAEIARIWRGGCIIRARLLERIRQAYAQDPPPTLLADPGVAEELGRAQDPWRRVVSLAVGAGVPVPGFSAALAYYDTVRAERLPASLIQGLRDLFGAHTYERTDGAGHVPHAVVGRPQRGAVLTCRSSRRGPGRRQPTLTPYSVTIPCRPLA